jgi:hypothetical protein
MDILIHVSIENLQLFGESRVAAAAGLFLVLDSSKLIYIVPRDPFRGFRLQPEASILRNGPRGEGFLRERRARNQGRARDRAGPQEAAPVSLMFLGHINLL